MNTTTTIAELKNQATYAKQNATLDETYVSIAERRLARIARIWEEEVGRGERSEELSVELVKAAEQLYVAKQKAEESKALAMQALADYKVAGLSV